MAALSSTNSEATPNPLNVIRMCYFSPPSCSFLLYQIKVNYNTRRPVQLLAYNGLPGLPKGEIKTLGGSLCVDNRHWVEQTDLKFANVTWKKRLALHPPPYLHPCLTWSKPLDQVGCDSCSLLLCWPTKHEKMQRPNENGPTRGSTDKLPS